MAQLPEPADNKDKDEVEKVVEDQLDVPMTEGRDRRALVTGDDFELNPQSLVGSFCHRIEGGDIQWAGVVVGDLGAGKYLVEIDKGLMGADSAKVQRVIPIEAITEDGWRFYDSEEAMNEAYAEYIVTVDLGVEVEDE